MHKDRRKGKNCCYRDFDTCLGNERQMETYSYISDSGGSHGPAHTQEKKPAEALFPPVAAQRSSQLGTEEGEMPYTAEKGINYRLCQWLKFLPIILLF